jgi:hypothetical protein
MDIDSIWLWTLCKGQAGHQGPSANILIFQQDVPFHVLKGWFSPSHVSFSIGSRPFDSSFSPYNIVASCTNL